MGIKNAPDKTDAAPLPAIKDTFHSIPIAFYFNFDEPYAEKLSSFNWSTVFKKLLRE
ncbi:MAG: hypothetical protein ACOX8P_02190 [Tepidanaerobacteraceae bacterium]|jgi:hypothetical protein